MLIDKRKLNASIAKPSLLKILFFVIIASFSSCNNEKSKEPVDKPTLDQQNPPPQVEAFNGPRFLTLHFDTAQLKPLFEKAGHNVRKIIFQYESRPGNVWGLKAYGARQNNVIVTGPISLNVIPGEDTVMLPQNAVLATMELSRGQFKELYGLNRGNKKERVDEKKMKHLRFTPSPVLGKDNAVFYIVTFLNVQPAVPAKPFTEGQTFTNPTPPGKPCDDASCDL